MSYTVKRKILSSDEIKQLAPLSANDYTGIEQHRKEIKAILSGQDPRLLMVIGPCSAWPNHAVLEYAKRLKVLAEQVKDVIKVVMRVYIQKPRTAKGWIGPVNQPDPTAAPDILAGIKYARKMMVEVVKMGLPIADEALFTHNADGFLELLSWVAIGARSTEDQEHRIFASAIDCPVGLKNPTHGSLEVAVNSVIAAQYPHVAVLNGYEVQTHGNDYAHIVLRGSKASPNYSVEHLAEVDKRLRDNSILNPAVMIDVSHDNCLLNGKKEPLQQARIVLDVLEQIQDKPNLNKLVKGFMLESFLKQGKQDASRCALENIDMGGLSITDPCLGWEESSALLLQLAEKIRVLEKEAA